MGAPMATAKPVEDPADAFLQPSDGVAISFWIISIAMIAATVFFYAEAATVTSHWKTSLHVGGLVSEWKAWTGLDCKVTKFPERRPVEVCMAQGRRYECSANPATH